jgi:hypothetical protein
MTDIGSPDTGARYFAVNGSVCAKLPNGEIVEAATALSANGRELDRHDRVLAIARKQRYQAANARNVS